MPLSTTDPLYVQILGSDQTRAPVYKESTSGVTALSIALLLCGGPPILNGIFLGRRVAIFATIYAIGLALLLAVLEDQGFIQTIFYSPYAIAAQVSLCLSFIGALVATYELEKNRVADELRTINDRQYSILESAGLGAWDWWTTSGTLRFDQRWCHILGLKKDEAPISKEDWLTIVHPEDRQKIATNCQACLDGKIQEFEVIYRAFKNTCFEMQFPKGP
jgi:PAS domain-containing protein